AERTGVDDMTSASAPHPSFFIIAVTPSQGCPASREHALCRDETRHTKTNKHGGANCSALASIF
ncbi:MAG: hypothetical protein K0M55_15140, partial [Rhizobium sp.]|nr:hypothetical protein [Rhizobium sp.]